MTYFDEEPPSPAAQDVEFINMTKEEEEEDPEEEEQEEEEDFQFIFMHEQ